MTDATWTNPDQVATPVRSARRGNAEGAWAARVEGPGLPGSRTRQFGIARHGRAEAQRLAEAWLIEQFGALETPSPGIAPETAPPVVAQARDGQFRGEDLDAIARVVTAKGNRWSVAVTRDRRRCSASFADLQHGGGAAARAVARRESEGTGGGTGGEGTGTVDGATDRRRPRPAPAR